MNYTWWLIVITTVSEELLTSIVNTQVLLSYSALIIKIWNPFLHHLVHFGCNTYSVHMLQRENWIFIQFSASNDASANTVLICILLLSAPPTLQACLYFILEFFVLFFSVLFPQIFEFFELRRRSDKYLALLAKGSIVLLKKLTGERSLRQSC